MVLGVLGYASYLHPLRRTQPSHLCPLTVSCRVSESCHNQGLQAGWLSTTHMCYHTEGHRVKAGLSAEWSFLESSRGGSALLLPTSGGCWGPLALRGLWQHVFNLRLCLQPQGRLFSGSGLCVQTPLFFRASLNQGPPTCNRGCPARCVCVSHSVVSDSLQTHGL